MASLSEKQLRAAELLESFAENIPDEVLNQIVDIIGESERPHAPGSPLASWEVDIKRQIMEESDWRKKAQLSALLISKGLD